MKNANDRMRDALRELGLSATTADERRAFGLASYYAGTESIAALVKAAQETKA